MIRFLRRIFPSRSVPPGSPGEGRVRFTDEWKPGDLGICIACGDYWCRRLDGVPVAGPKLDQLVRVVDAKDIDGFAGLVLRGWGSYWWQADLFLKVPPAKAEPCSEEFRRSLDRVKRKELVDG